MWFAVINTSILSLVFIISVWFADIKESNFVFVDAVLTNAAAKGTPNNPTLVFKVSCLACVAKVVILTTPPDIIEALIVSNFVFVACKIGLCSSNSDSILFNAGFKFELIVSKLELIWSKLSLICAVLLFAVVSSGVIASNSPSINAKTPKLTFT